MKSQEQTLQMLTTSTVVRAHATEGGGMPDKIFVSYWRDDDPNGAARIRDALTAKFGRSSPTVAGDRDTLI